MTPAGRTLFELWNQSVRRHGDRTAVVSHRRTSPRDLTYEELSVLVLKAADRFAAMGLDRGDRAVILLENGPEFVAAFFAVTGLGAVAVPVDCQSPPHQVREFVLHSGARLLIAGQVSLDKLRGVLPPMKTVSFSCDTWMEGLAGCSIKAGWGRIASVESEDLAALFYTSGTTDRPKAVMLTHGNITANIRSQSALGIISPADRILAFLPLHHTYALTVSLLGPLAVGATVVFPGGISGPDLLAAAAARRITIFIGVPQVFAHLHRSIRKGIEDLPGAARVLLQVLTPVLWGLRRTLRINLSRVAFHRIHALFGGRLRFLISGGARLDPLLTEDFFRWGFTLLEGYGLTETSPVVSFNPPRTPKIGSVGLPLPGVEVRIVDPNGRGVGEVAVKGPNVMRGYYRNAEATREVLGDDGWFLTGDLGYRDAKGYLFLTGRKKETIVLSNGKNIQPERLEDHYTKSPFIRELCVLPWREREDLKGVEHLAAVIVVEEEAFRRSNAVGYRDKIKWELDSLAADLPPYEHIAGFVLTKDPLPRTRLGKIMRHRVPEIYARLRASIRKTKEKTPASEDRPARRVRELVERILQRPVSLDDHWELDWGLDSLSRMELLLGLQEAIGIEVPEERAGCFFGCNTIRDLVEQLRRIAPETLTGYSNETTTSPWERILMEPREMRRHARVISPREFARAVPEIILWGWLRFISILCFRMRVTGRGHLQRRGPFLICPNHASYLDGLLVWAALPLREALRTHFVGFSEIFNRMPLKMFARHPRLILIDINSNLIEALRACADIMEQGGIVCYFPEGQRSVDGNIQPFKKGVGILIRELGVPVVPTYIHGTFDAWPRHRRYPRPAAVRILFGRMVDLPELGKGGADSYQSVADALRLKVCSMKRHLEIQSYRTP